MAWRVERRNFYPDLIWEDTVDGRQYLIAEVRMDGVAQEIVDAHNAASDEDDDQ